MNARATLALFAALTAGSPASIGLAHEDAVLKSSRSSVSAAATLDLTGADFNESAAYKLRLLGALSEYDLREVETDSAGTFSIELAIPADVRPGSYQVVAVASDGDVVARLDLTVLEAASPATTRDGSPEDAGEEAQGARADELRIERPRGSMEWGVIGLVVGLAGGLGIGVLWRTTTQA